MFGRLIKFSVVLAGICVTDSFYGEEWSGENLRELCRKRIAGYYLSRLDAANRSRDTYQELQRKIELLSIRIKSTASEEKKLKKSITASPILTII